MKRKIKAAISTLLVAAMLLSLSPFNGSVVADLFSTTASAEGEGGFEFELNDEGTGYVLLYGDDDISGDITIPSTYNGLPVTRIGGGAFHGRENLTSISIPASVTSIGEYAFTNCPSLATVSFEQNSKLTDIGNYAFQGCGFTSITIPKSVKNIGVAAFSFCTYMETVSFEAGISLASINEGVFGLCSALKNITIPSSVTTIGKLAFMGCDSLTNIIIPSSVTVIEPNAFAACNSLESINIPSSVTNIGEGVFAFNHKMKSINVDSSNINYSSQDGVLFNKDKSALLQYPCGNARTSYEIPSSVTSINVYAFYECTSLISISIPSGVTSIVNSAFYNCESLTSITIPNSVTSIGDGVFWSCTSLVDVYYSGTEEEWNNITIGSDNEPLNDATIHYNSAPPVSNTYTVTWDVDGEKTIVEYESGAEIVLPENPTKTGYKFKGWTPAVADTMPENDVVYKVVWDANTYTVKFYDGDYLLGSKTIKYDESSNLSYGEVPTKAGFNFVGWSNVKGGPALFTNGQSIRNLSDTQDAIVNYYAAWDVVAGETVVEDDDTGVELIFPDNTYDGEVTLVVEEVLSGSAFDILERKEDIINPTVFNIKTLLNGVETQPNGTVKVKIPIPENVDISKCKLYYVNMEAGTLEEYMFRVESGYIVFTTTHFSNWALAEVEGKIPTIKINNNPGTKTINYGEGIEFTAAVTDLPEGAMIKWYVNGAEKGTGTTFKFTDAKADATITVKIVDKNGNTLKDATDGEISESEKITVNAGFFQKLISFFKNLFRINRIIAQAFIPKS